MSIGSGVLDPWRSENRDVPLTRQLALTNRVGKYPIFSIFLIFSILMSCICTYIAKIIWNLLPNNSMCVCALHIRWFTLHCCGGEIWQKFSNTEKMLRAQVIRQQNTRTENQNIVTMCHIKKFKKLDKNRNYRKYRKYPIISSQPCLQTNSVMRTAVLVLVVWWILTSSKHTYRLHEEPKQTTDRCAVETMSDVIRDSTSQNWFCATTL